MLTQPPIFWAKPPRKRTLSTVIDLTTKPKILREGGLSSNIIEKFLKVKLTEDKSKIVKSPGQIGLHYSPGIPIYMNREKATHGGALIVFGKKTYNNHNTFNLSINGKLKDAAKNFFNILRIIKNKKFESISINKIPHLVKIIIIFAAMSIHAFFSISVMSATTLLDNGFFALLERPWATDLLADQKLGGSIGWAMGEIPILLALLATFMQWQRADKNEANRIDRAADRAAAMGEDDELAQYNRYLAQLNRRDLSQ